MDQNLQETIDHIAEVLYKTLGGDNPNPRQRVFDIWPRSDRLIIVINPNAKSKWEMVLNKNFSDRLRLKLQGRQVIVSQPAKRGLFLQIGIHPPPIKEYKSLPLDVHSKPVGMKYAVPIGMTANGPMWINFVEGDSYLIGGSRGMGKTTLSHAWIQSLIAEGLVELYLWDGKNGAEYNRYAKYPKVHVARELSEVLVPLKQLVDERERTLLAAGVPGVNAWNEKHTPKMEPLAVFIDEAAFVPENAIDAVKDLVARGRSYGVHPVIATQRPGVSEVQPLVKANLTTRIAFPVPSRHESGVILGRTGAEKIVKVPGRLIMNWRAREVTAQAYSVTLPDPDYAEGERVEWPQGKDLRVLRDIDAIGGTVTIETIKVEYDMAYNPARGKLHSWVQYGWVCKAGKADKDGHKITEALHNYLSDEETSES